MYNKIDSYVKTFLLTKASVEKYEAKIKFFLLRAAFSLTHNPSVMSQIYILVQ